MPQLPKLMFVIPTLLGGGAERVLVQLVNRLSDDGFDCTIVSLKICKPVYHIDSKVRVLFVCHRVFDSRFSRIKDILITFTKMLYYLMRYKPFCCTSFITSANIWTAISCKIIGIKYVLSERTAPERSLQQIQHLKKKFISWLYKGAYSVVVSTKSAKENILQIQPFNRLNNINIIPNAVTDLGSVDSIPVHHRKFILAVGRLEKVKGFDILISAFSKCTVEDVDLLIVGDGSQRSALICDVLNLGLRDRIFFVGNQTALQNYYSQCELFVLCSRYEGYPNALVEAMSQGSPCISINCKNGPSEIIESYVNGILINTYDELPLTIDRLLKAKELRTYFSRNARKINDTNSNDRIANCWMRILASPSCI